MTEPDGWMLPDLYCKSEDNLSRSEATGYDISTKEKRREEDKKNGM